MTRIRASILLFYFMIPFYICGQNDPARPVPLDERLNSDSVKFVWIENGTADIYPVPVDIKYSDRYHDLFDDNGNPVAVILFSNKGGERAARMLNRLLQKFNYGTLPAVNNKNSIPLNTKIIFSFLNDNRLLKKYGEQSYSIKWNSGKVIEVVLSGVDLKGVLYCAASLSQLVVRNYGRVMIREADLTDYPSFKRRMFNSKPVPNHIQYDLDWMIRHKIETISFHNTDYSWDKLDYELAGNLEQFSDWSKQYGGVEGLLLLNLYKGDPIEISNKDHLLKIKNVIGSARSKSVSRVMILADDTPPFKFGEGYVLPSSKDREKFSSMAEAHVYLMNELVGWSKKNNLNIEFYYCPSFYTYEEMHYGDMELYTDTPWEDAAYKPLKRDLKIIGDKMNKNVHIMWTGPYVCTRTLTDQDLKDWTSNLSGRVPFLFDNSIFAQLDYTARTMFTPYQNDFPSDFGNKTGGNGIFINGDGVGESSRAATLTANAYMWEGDSYNPSVSLINAMTKLYGADALNTMFRYKETELELVKEIKQREIWYAADELWKSIRDTRFITEKNPFHYHLNYGRFKALRMQLKYSVPEPEDYESFKRKCIELDKKRRLLIDEIEKLSFNRLSYTLQMEMVKLPDFDNQ